MNDIEKAIEVLKMENELMQFDPNTGEDYPIELQNEINQDIYKANLVAISALEKQFNGGWIPVSEKLPSSDGRFEVTIKGSKGKRYVEMCNFYKDAEIHKWGGKYNSFNVIAWRSRPEPYKEVGQ